MSRNCAACHTGVGSKGEFVMFTQPGLFNPRASWSAIYDAVASGHMPPKSSQYRLALEEAEAIKNFARAQRK